MDKYDVIKDLGSGSFGITRLLRHREIKELVGCDFIERGPKVNSVLNSNLLFWV